MLKERYKMWIIFAVVCLLIQCTILYAPSCFEMIGEKIAESQTVAENTADPTQPSENEQESEPKTEKTTMQNKLSALINVLANVMKYLGIVIVIFGIFSLVMGYLHDNPEMNARAIMQIVIGCAMIGLTVILTKIFW